jgi:hypothetical protein
MLRGSPDEELVILVRPVATVSEEEAADDRGDECHDPD